jgi:HSP20 family molecular chaperone IbpA
MSTESKLKLVLVFSLLCLMGLLIQGYMLWQVQAQLVSESDTQPNLPESIEQRLDAALGGSSKQLARPSPFDMLGQPFGADPFSQMQQQVDSLFGMLSAPSVQGFHGIGSSSTMPELSLTETDSEYQVSVSAPSDTDVEITTELEANLLTVRGSVTEDYSDSSSGRSANFVSRSQFTRSFDLPKPVDELGVFTETANDGLLIHVPKK